MTSSDVNGSVRTPRKWLRVSKYLLPLGYSTDSHQRVRPPRQQVKIAQLAADHPQQVSLRTWGQAEVLPEQAYDCFAGGNSERHVLSSKFVPPAFVAEIRDGLSYGRHCCVIGPARKAVRETGYHLDSVVLIEQQPISALRLQYWRKRWEGDVTTLPWLPPKQRIAGRVAVLNTQFSHNFYHWMIDILPRLAPLRKLGITADHYLVDCLSPFQQTVLAALGIERQQLIQPHFRLLLEAEQLIVPSLPIAACWREMGSMLADGLAVTRGRTHRRIYISRRKKGTRTVVDEEALEKLLCANGFETHFMEAYPLATQAQLIADSEIIIAPHGAGLANLIFAQPRTHVIEIVPAGRYNATLYPELSRVMGLVHHQILAERDAGGALRFSLRDIEMALRRAEHAAQLKAVA
jgi:capsular polysaccharide biosynthesis protein